MNHPPPLLGHATVLDGAEYMAIERLLDAADVSFGPLRWRINALIAERDRLAAQLAERSRETDYARLLGMLEQDRTDVLYMLADAAADSPDEVIRRRAAGWHWLAAGRKHPSERPKGWHWFQDENLPGRARQDCDRLPQQLRLALAANPLDDLYPTARAALEAVVDAITERRWQP